MKTKKQKSNKASLRLITQRVAIKQINLFVFVLGAIFFSSLLSPNPAQAAEVCRCVTSIKSTTPACNDAAFTNNTALGSSLDLNQTIASAFAAAKDAGCSQVQQAGAPAAIMANPNVAASVSLDANTCETSSISQTVSVGSAGQSVNFSLGCTLAEGTESAGGAGTTKDRCDDPGVFCLKNPLGSDPEKTDLRVIVADVIRNAMAVIGSITLLVFFAGGVMWLTSAGNPERVKKGTNTMLYAVIGLAVIFSAYAILNTVIRGLTGS